MAVKWGAYEDFQYVNDQYLPSNGEGENMATQAVTAVTKLVYKWYNDGDVFDNSYGMEGWANDLSSYANWLYYHINGADEILKEIEATYDDGEYEDLLYSLTSHVFDDERLEKLSKIEKIGSIYDCEGPFKFEEHYDDEEDEDEEW